MEKSGWKTVAIIFLILFVLENLFFIWSVSVVEREERQLKECYFDQGYCGGYPEAKLEEGVCHCYDYDVTGANVVLVKSFIMD